MAVQANPELAYFLGFLAGQLDRVHFVRSLEGAPVAVRLSAGRRRLWPGGAFEAVVRGVPIPSPAMAVSALLESDDDICVRIDMDDLLEAAWFQEMTHASYEEARAGGRDLADRIEHLRGEIDRALDVYRECRKLLEGGEAEREKELRFFLGMAQREIEALSAQLTQLNAKLKERRGSAE